MDGCVVIRAMVGILAKYNMRDGGRIPAIALTAYVRSEDRTRALAVGYHAHVAKPVEPSELVATIASLVGLSRS